MRRLLTREDGFVHFAERTLSAEWRFPRLLRQIVRASQWRRCPRGQLHCFDGRCSRRLACCSHRPVLQIALIFERLHEHLLHLHARMPGVLRLPNVDAEIVPCVRDLSDGRTRLLRRRTESGWRLEYLLAIYSLCADHGIGRTTASNACVVRHDHDMRELHTLWNIEWLDVGMKWEKPK